MQQKNRINRLPKDVADKIAAGEVVDRPLSIIKELLENSIDAEADSIIIEIKNGGKTYIRVTDNGCGIPGEDLLLAFERHATSKIYNADDLNSIKTLGFRGEALASIAAVSRVEVITKTRDRKFGSRIKIEGGRLSEQADAGCPDGTTVIVSDLFYNTPVRQKFMKQDSAESSLIIDFVSKMALAYPNIRIRLINNGTILFSTPGKGNVQLNILTVYSKEIGDKLIKIKNKAGDYSLDAYVSPPGVSKTNRKHQVFFVNGRYISSKIIENAVAEAYAELLSDGRHPIVFLFLTIDPQRLDVNIHPNKREIRFDNNTQISEFIVNTLRSGLITNEALPELTSSNAYKRKQPVLSQVNNIVKDDPIKDEGRKEQVDIISLLSASRVKADREAVNPAGEADNDYKDYIISESGKDQPQASKSVSLPEISINGSIFGTYITGTDKNNLYLIDQHAAHERVFYERLMDQSGTSEKTSQLLIAPFVIETTFGVFNHSNEIVEKLESLGYAIEEFGIKSFIVKEIPVFMTLSEARDFIDSFMDQIDENTSLKDPAKTGKIIMNACKSAVKANRHLDIREMEQLLKDLSETKNPMTCPHGRPTLIKLSKYEIEKMFKRN